MKRISVKFLQKVSIALFFIFCLYMSRFVSVRADIAPPDPPRAANPEAVDSTNVQMIAENILLDVGASSSQNLWAAKVTANFTMRNLGDTIEELDVHFPLDYTFYAGEISCENPSPMFPSITDLQVWVDDQPKAIRIEYITVELFAEQEPYPKIDIPCWAHFQISFPPQKDTIIRITYTAQPYDNYAAAQYEYAYILETGAGWEGTIGSADITFRFPYEINVYNIYSCSPENCSIGKNEVSWHFDDFEPDFNVDVKLLPPPLWKIISTEAERVAKNPKDGEAWGRLGKAYKEAVILPKIGFREAMPDFDMYQLSKNAYEKALELLPNDADWHFGYAELLCHKAELDQSGPTNFKSSLIACINQLKAALDLNPSHEKARELLQNLQDSFWVYCVVSSRCVEVADLNGSQPNYLILTPQIPTQTSTAIKSSTPTVRVIEENTSTTRPANTPHATASSMLASTSTIIPKADALNIDTPSAQVDINRPTSRTFPFLEVASIGIFAILAIVILRAVLRKR